MRRVILAVALLAAGPALAQAPAAPAKPAAAKSCMRLPLSDIAFGKEATIAQTRMRLDEYAAEEAKRRGFGGKTLAKSNETIECDVYLVLPFLGTEYKCLITTTFCTK